MNRILKVTRLQLNKTRSFLLTPPTFFLVLLIVSIVIALAIQRATGMDPTTPAYIAGARWNQAIVWSVPGYLVYFGVQAVGTTYPFALALGTTRRNFILGTMLTNMLHALYFSAIVVLALGAELLTNHWFLGVYVLDVHFLGTGNALIAGATTFLGTLFFLTIGGLFAGLWVRFGSRGPAILGLASGLVLAVALLAIAPQLGSIAVQLTRTTLALVAVGVIAAALFGTWLAMRKASVR